MVVGTKLRAQPSVSRWKWRQVALTRTLNEETLARFLDTHVLPDPDLVVRTSGEARISNFLLWQSAYSEYEFVDTLWPDFTPEELKRLCNAYGSRDRRFGGVRA